MTSGSPGMAASSWHQAAPSRRATIVALGSWAGSVLVLAIGLSSTPLNAPVDASAAAATVLAVVSTVTVGAILVIRLPRNSIGWLLLTGGALIAIATAGSDIVAGSTAPRDVAVTWIALVTGLAWIPFIVLLGIFLPLLYPSGHLPSARWRPVAVLGAIAIALSVIQNLFSPYAPGIYPAGFENPLAAGGPVEAIATVFGMLNNVIGIVALPLVAASLVGRYRHATTIERQQLKWLAAVMAVVGPAMAVAIVTKGASGIGGGIGTVAWLIVVVGFGLLPVAIGFAVLRYRLYDIDVIIRRTAVYVPLTAILAGVYAASIAALQRLFIVATGNPSDGAVILSTLILAATFTPIKSTVQAAVDRRFRDAPDGGRRLRAFTDRLAVTPWALDESRTMRAFLVESVDAVGAAGGRAYVGDGSDERLVGSTGAGSGEVALGVPVEAAGRQIGRLELDGRPGHRSFSDADAELLTDAGGRLGRILAGLPDTPLDSPRRVASALSSTLADAD